MERYMDTSLTPEQRAQSLIPLMTLREKVGQLNQRLYGFSCYRRQGDDIELTEEFYQEVERWSGLGVLYGLLRADPWSGRTRENGLEGLNAIRAYNMVQRAVLERSRFGIPVLNATECPHGHQALGGYLLPCNLAMGATWNPALLHDAYALCGKQLKELGMDMAWIAVLDILRDPRWGRTEECYGEDPYLASKLGEAAITGCQSQGVDAVAKHLCAQGETTGGVNLSAARIGPRELREIHLPPLKAAVCRAKVKGVLAAYNEIDGLPCHANPWLLRTLLREEYGFTGFVIADGTAIDRLDVLTGDNTASGALALKAGLDISLWDTAFTKLEQAVERGLVEEKLVDQAVQRVLEVKFRRGLFEHPFLEETPPAVYTFDQYPQTLELARQSVVLLKNNRVLPLTPAEVKSVAVIGPHADNVYYQLGDYTPPQREGDTITLLEGLRRLSGSGVEIRYAQGCSLLPGADNDALIREAVQTAASCDAVILAVGGSSSRFDSAEFDKTGAAVVANGTVMDCGEGVDTARLVLPGEQERLAKAVKAVSSRLVTVVIAGKPYAIEEIDALSDALLYAFYPGPAGGLALAEILWGQISPSGRLPVSLPRHVGQLPVYYNYKTSYTGMNYFDMPPQPLYPFGYGLSYAPVSAVHVQMSQASVPLEDLKRGERIAVDVELANKGSMETDAVVQLYIRDMQASVIRRVKELKAFQRLSLPAGANASCQLTLGWEELTLWDADMQETVEPGTFRLWIEEGGCRLWEGSLEVM